MKTRRTRVALPVCLLILALAALPVQADESTAAAKIAAGEIHLQAGNADRAIALAEEALGAAPDSEQVRKDAAGLIGSALAAKEAKAAEEAKKKQEEAAKAMAIATLQAAAKLDEAERLVDDGRFAEAQEILTPELLDKLSGDQLERAGRLLEKSHPALVPRKLGDLWRGWVSDAVGALIFLIALWILVAASRRVYARYARISLGEVEDSTELGLGDLVLSGIDRWCSGGASAAAGLLWLAPPEAAVVPAIEKTPPTVDLATAFTSLPKVGGVEIKWVAQLLAAIPKWIRALQPRITANCLVEGTEVIVQLSYRDRDGRIQTVRAEAEKKPEAIRAAVESATYQLYYLIANPAAASRVAVARAADRLRLGIEELRRYVALGQSDSLQRAHDTFVAVRYEEPQLLEASLYEGVSLDLLERHDRAREVFLAVAGQADGDLRVKARYNQAVTHFREYTPEDFQQALGIFDELITEAGVGAAGRIPQKPLIGLVLAAQANAIAHQPIFWQQFACKAEERSQDPSVVLARKADAMATVGRWGEEVRETTEQVEALSEAGARSDPEAWTPAVRRQLRWAIHNARGNLHLNLANNFYVEPHLPPAAKSRQEQDRSLECAYEEFRRCEAILRPGVETLTNLATVLNSLRRLKDGRDYAERAIKLNPEYQYAYYRLALNWELEGDESKVKETLARLPKPPRKWFASMFEEYGVEPKQ